MRIFKSRNVLLLIGLILLAGVVSADTMIISPSTNSQLYYATSTPGLSWSDIINQPTGTAGAETVASYSGRLVAHASISGNYTRSENYATTWNTSFLAGKTLTSAVFRFKISGTSTSLLGQNEISLVRGYPADGANYAGGDYSKYDRIDCANRYDYTTYGVGYNANFTLSNLSCINQNGNTSLYLVDGDVVDGTLSAVWSASASRLIRVRPVGYTTEADRPYGIFEYTSGGDTTPPAAVTGLANGTYTCPARSMDILWTNPTDPDLNTIGILVNGTWRNQTNSTTSLTLTSLPENTIMTVNVTTVDLTGNQNLTHWQNISFTTESCAIPTTTPTTEPTTTVTTTPPTTVPTTAPPALAGCKYTNLTGVTLVNSTEWTITMGNVSWGTYQNVTEGNVSIWSCIGTPTPTPTQPPWAPDINPSTEGNFRLDSLISFWWIPALLLLIYVLFRRT